MWGGPPASSGSGPAGPSPAPTSSTIFFSSMCLGPRLTAEQVTTILGVESEMRPASDSAEKPAKTTEKTAPRRAQASCGAQRRARHVGQVSGKGKRLGRRERAGQQARRRVHKHKQPHSWQRPSHSTNSMQHERRPHHGGRQLGDHGHVDGHVVALAHTLALHVVCDLQCERCMAAGRATWVAAAR